MQVTCTDGSNIEAYGGLRETLQQRNAWNATTNSNKHEMEPMETQETHEDHVDRAWYIHTQGRECREATNQRYNDKHGATYSAHRNMQADTYSKPTNETCTPLVIDTVLGSITWDAPLKPM